MQIPKQFGCMDQGSKFYSSLSIFGKILYLLRPLMIRKKKRKKGSPCSRSPSPICKSHRDRYDYHYNPVGSKLYFGLIANSLQSIYVTDNIHIGKHDLPMFTNIYDDSTAIVTHYSDTNFINQWLLGKRITYMFTFDYCVFPLLEKIQFPNNIEKVMTVQNAGGSSDISEFMSMYYMYHRFRATNFIPEMEVNYDYISKICDYLMDINNTKIGVSVTRGILYPFDKTIPLDFATSLLYKKLIGIILAKKSVTVKQKFETSIVHVWCKSWEDAYVIRKAYENIINSDIYNLYVNIYVSCTVCCSDFIYSNTDS